MINPSPVNDADQGRPHLIAKAVQYGLAAVGPIGVAGSQFLLSVYLLHTLTPALFGSFSFLLVASQLSTGVWSALFSAPMPILLATGPQEQRNARRRHLMAANLGAAFLMAVFFAGLAYSLRTPTSATLLFAAFGALNLIRWFARSYAYATGFRWRTIISDIIYTLTLLAGMAFTALGPSISLPAAYVALLTAAVAGLAPFGLTFLRQQFIQVSLRDFPGYREIWRAHSGWSLTGVLTTEATGNAHAYLVTLISGAAAYAPLAASALLMRPVSVASNALTDFERPQMARWLDQGRPLEATHAIHTFRLMLAAVWVGTIAVAAAIMTFAPGVLFPAEYDRTHLMIGTALWLTVAGVRLMRTPENVLLQAAGQFKPLAHASMISSGVSLIAVCILLLVGGPLWSLVGIICGEIVFAVWTWREKARWLSALADGVDQRALSIRHEA